MAGDCMSGGLRFPATAAQISPARTFFTGLSQKSKKNKSDTDTKLYMSFDNFPDYIEKWNPDMFYKTGYLLTFATFGINSMVGFCQVNVHLFVISLCNIIVVSCICLSHCYIVRSFAISLTTNAGIQETIVLNALIIAYWVRGHADMEQNVHDTQYYS